MGRRSTIINLNSLIYPYFVAAGKGKAQEIKSFPGIRRFSVDRLLKDISETKKLGINKILLFGVSDKKDNLAKEAFREGNIVSLAVKEIKNRFTDLTVMTDVCLCAYTSHGHCRLFKGGLRVVDERKTLGTLAKIALSYAQAGADWVAPSAMAKRQVRVIRGALDENGFHKVKIMGYSAKFASSFYGPFRNAARSSPLFGDRSGYQLDPADSRKALDKIKDDIKEGADMVMVKPALSYLDIIRQTKEKYDFPLAAFNVSGEYALVKYGARHKLWNEQDIVREIITSIKRAGSDFIITYHAKDIARWQSKIS